MKEILTILFIFVFTFTSISQNEKKYIRQGNKLYNQKNYNDAEVDYRKSLIKDSTYTIGKFNLADALYKQKNYEEAARLFSDLAAKETNKELKSKMYHNLGNSLLQTKEYEKSIEAYKNSLKSNPNDIDTKYNLAYAMQMLRQQQQNKDKKDNKDNKKDKDQNKKEEKQNENKQNDQNKENQQDKDKNKQEQKQKQLKKEEAERMLEALKNDEKRTIDKVKKQKAIGVKVKTEKDW